jgi:hypothetical protein
VLSQSSKVWNKIELLMYLAFRGELLRGVIGGYLLRGIIAGHYRTTKDATGFWEKNTF